MSKYRIVKSTDGNGCEVFLIEKKGWLFWHRMEWREGIGFLQDYTGTYDRAIELVEKFKREELSNKIVKREIISRI